ncbi:putative E3 ubiquitin-protein ligase HIP1 [Camellia lanceoleosa]|uniref:E3 ubiquitin-protein ligase HIP1 n=1 Tax=Camellia lanceoleosa TaxID=1840588 RepID=A0ACC0IKV3_9ERIC|nr:putative E3 ubiquitin-protein ligase HIP1 [Camellia lanceoleosa]
MWEVTPETEALKLAPCAMAAQDEKSDVPNNSCQQVKKLGQNPGCLCAVMLSDTAKFLSNLQVSFRHLISTLIRRALQVLHWVEDGIIVHEQPLFYEEPDVHENMRLDELLALEDQIGNVSAGLSEEAILAAVRRHCYLSMKLGPLVEEEPCCICQEDYVDGKELGPTYFFFDTDLIAHTLSPYLISPGKSINKAKRENLKVEVQVRIRM